MRICFTVLYYTPEETSADPDAYLSRVPIFREIPRRLAGRGHRVDVVLAYPFDLDYSEDEVRYHFVAAGRLSRALSSAAARILRRGRANFEMAHRAIARVLELDPEIVHFAGTTVHLNLVLLLRRLCADVPLVLHHHGGTLAKRWLTRRLQLPGLRRASRLLVSSLEHGRAFVASGAISDAEVVEFMETSSPFRWRPSSEARRETGLRGRPIYLSAGRLHPVKDPMTLLRGFERIAAVQGEARLYLCYLTGEMRDEMGAWLASRPELEKRVTFLGRLEPEELEAVMNSADFLLQASRREWSGIAVLDAMACGVIPVVSDIAAFRAMLGEVPGLLFPVGDDEALARRALLIGEEGIEARSNQVRRRFEDHLSFERLSARLEEIYLELVGFR